MSFDGRIVLVVLSWYIQDYMFSLATFWLLTITLMLILDCTAAYPQPLKHTVRSQLATMIHRKLAAIKPLLVEIVLPRLPDMWSATLREALQHVRIHL